MADRGDLDEEDVPAFLHWLAWAEDRGEAAGRRRRAAAEVNDDANGDAPAEYALTYVLTPDLPEPTQRPGLAHVHALAARRRDGGRWSVARPVDPFSLPLPIEERLAWATISAADPEGATRDGGCAIGPTERDALDALVSTGLARVGHRRGPRLRAGAARSGRPVWHIDAEGLATLGVSVVEVDRAWVVPVSPPVYVDLDTGDLGELSLEGTATVDVIASAPALEIGAMDLLTRDSVLRAFARLGLPLPDFRRHAEAVVARPRPGKVALEVDVAAGRIYAVATVLYDGYELELCLPWIDRAIDDHVDLGDSVIEVERRVDDEHALAAMLLDEGFVRHYDPRRTLRADADGPVPDAAARLALRLQDAGWHVTIDGVGFRLADVEGWWAHAVEAGAEAGVADSWDLSVGVEVDGARVDLLPAVVRWIESGAFRKGLGEEAPEGLLLRLDDGRYVELPVARIERLVDTLIELSLGPRVLSDGRLSLGPLDAPRIVAAMDAVGQSRGAPEALARLAERVGAATRPTPVAEPPGLETTLRPYQAEGVAWMQWLAATGLSGVLADDMGLGKTVQALAHLLSLHQAGALNHGALVVAPTSVVHAWAREAARFAPGLSVVVVHGPRRDRLVAQLAPDDVVITSHALLPRDVWLRERQWSAVIVDEAHALKNPTTAVAKAARKLRTPHRVALTGTPVENDLGELWALMDFVMPGALGSRAAFGRAYRRPIERTGDVGRLRHLQRRLGPVLLRRLKRDVLEQLPPKTEVDVAVELRGAQRDLYEAVRLTLEPRVSKALAAGGLGRNQVLVLEALLKLRQTCCDPRLLPGELAEGVEGSAKLDALEALLDGVLPAGRRVLVFSQFTSMLALIGARLTERGIGWLSLTGDTPAAARGGLVARFEAGEAPVFLLSLKAGGSGLNLTSADVVIHYDPWWNPAAQAQATDRAHRIGQTRPVTVYRLHVVGSVESRILEMQARKRRLAEGLHGESGTGGLSIGPQDIQRLLAPLDAPQE